MNAVIKPNEAPATSVELTVPDEIGRLMTKGQYAVDIAESFNVDYSEEMYVAVTAQLRESKADAKSVDEQRKIITRPLDELKARTIAYYQPTVNNFTKATQVYTGILNRWDDELEAKRKAEQARLEEIARKEREEKEAKARAAEEAAKKKADELRRKAQEAEAAGNDREAVKLTIKAENIEEAATEKAEDLRTAADMTAAPVIASAIPVTKGMSKAKNYSAELVDIVELAKAVAAGTLPPQWLAINQTFANQQARAFKENFNVPGVKLVTSTTRRSTGK